MFIRTSDCAAAVRNAQVLTLAKRRSVIVIFIHGMWTADVVLKEFARVIGRVFQ